MRHDVLFRISSGDGLDNRYCRYVFDLFSPAVETILTATMYVSDELRLALLRINLQILKDLVRFLKAPRHCSIKDVDVFALTYSGEDLSPHRLVC